jgi:glycosyltransferase involved in cell wall biosynthesis
VVPVYNEAGLIEDVIKRIGRCLDSSPSPYRVLVLNDGSTDWTEELERRLLRAGPVEVNSYCPNRGKGAMIDELLTRLETGLAVVIDADGEYPPEEIPRVLLPLQRGEADWVLGSRYGFGRRRPGQYRSTYLVNRMVSGMFGALAGVVVHDLLTGLYAFRAELVSGLRLRERRFAYTPELMWKVLRGRAARLREVPVEYRFRDYAQGKKIKWWETATILAAILRYRTGEEWKPRP